MFSDSSDAEATMAESSSTHLYSAQYNKRCSVPSSSDIHHSLQSHLLLNPESPPFQPLSKLSPISNAQTFPGIAATNKLCPDLSLSATKLSAIPSGSTSMPTVKLKQSNSCLPQPPIQSASSVIDCDTSFASPTSSLQPIGRSGALAQCNTPISSVPFSNNQVIFI